MSQSITPEPLYTFLISEAQNDRLDAYQEISKKTARPLSVVDKGEERDVASPSAFGLG